MENKKFPQLKLRDFIPLIGPIFYIDRASNLQERIGVEEYQRESRPSARIRGAALLIYNVEIALYSPEIIKGIESFFS